MYKPTSFNNETMHAMKYLYLFDRRGEIVREIMKNCDEDVSNFPEIVGKAFIESMRVLQLETGMLDENLDDAVAIGTMIAEYRFMMNMSEEERNEYIDFVENSTEDDIPEDFKEVLNTLKETREDTKQINNLFKKLINDFTDEV
jgi:hypothetical protein